MPDVSLPLAHSANTAGQTHALRDHLSAVGDLAGRFAGAASWREEAQLAGQWHDLGKYGERFQARLRGGPSGIDHWSAGAWAACIKRRAIAAALAIQGHHIGLQRCSKSDLQALDDERLANRHPLELTLSAPCHASLVYLGEADGVVPPQIYRPLLPQIPAVEQIARMLDVRLLFSALVDADFLDTEAHFAGDVSGKRYRRSGPVLDPVPALAALERHRDTIRRDSSAPEVVTRLRDDLWQACLRAAGALPGLWSLTAPTGAGKTLAMAGFALYHARCNQLRRIVFVIPYLTIIEQTAALLRDIFEPIFGPECVVEHHSLAGGGAESSTDDAVCETERRRRLLAENWDAPVIVTTSVQLLESLFSNRPSACRKLHRLMGSVLLFDEVQTLPLGLAVPTLGALAHLSKRYRTSVVFATATQPAFGHLDEPVRRWAGVGWQAREMAPPNLFGRLRRTVVQWPDLDRTLEWATVADTLAAQLQALCVVNLKRHARTLVERLKGAFSDGLFHLSTSMCAGHRTDTLARVRHRLRMRRRCLLVSTQCIEAGVDIDFPVVWRAFGPLDAIAQAAGRCNREGTQTVGEVTVFLPRDGSENAYPSPAYRQAAELTLVLLRSRGAAAMDINDPDLFRDYFRQLYDVTRPEAAEPALQRAITTLDFAEVARRYRLIKDDAINVVVPYGNSWEAAVKTIRHARGYSAVREGFRAIRPFTVALYRPREANSVWNFLEPLWGSNRGKDSDWYIYREPTHYDPLLGLVVPGSADILIG